jgi:ornithine--oxo-acid transaminase
VTRSTDIIELTEDYSARNYHPLDVVLTRGEGIWVWDAEGTKYLDMLSSYSALNQGHRHPRIMKALAEQAEKLTLTSRAFHNDQLGPLCEYLCKLSGMDLMLPMNTGAEAVETAIKIVRKWAYLEKGVPRHEAEIIVAHNNFHGRTVTVVSFSSEDLYKKDFGPFTPGFHIVEYGSLEAIRSRMSDHTAAVLIEPIQGEAGIIIPPEGYLREVRSLCKERNVLFALDEIQTGLCRTGKLFCYMHEDAEPDLLILGKAMGGGVLPISAVLSKRDVLGLFTPGEHGSTFGGNPLACAVAMESLRVLVEERMDEKALELGTYFMERLRAMDSPHVLEVRGKGLLIGVQLKAEAGGARRFCEALKERGLLCKETHEDVIRFAPPLVITKEDIDWAIEQIGPVLAA